MLQALPEDTDLGLYLSCLRAAIDKMEVQFAAVAADFAGGEQWDDEGANSAADWLRFHCHMTSGAAWNALQVGKQMSKLPQSLEALRQGEIGYAHLATLANTADKLKGFGESEFSLPLPAATVQRLACDSSVMRVLFEADSLPVDVGRSRRLVDGGLRKALAVRDKHCQWPGCERPASWCDGHHLVHWVDGGETNLENTVLLCKRHHRMVHEGGWKLIKVEGKIVSIAPTVTFGLPRGPD